MQRDRDLPKGDYWKYSDPRVNGIQPSPDLKLVTRPQGILAEVTTRIGEGYLNPEAAWRLQAVVGNEGYLAIVFTDKSKPDTTLDLPDPEALLKPRWHEEVPYWPLRDVNAWVISSKKIDEVLVGTNRVCEHRPLVKYNEYRVRAPRRNDDRGETTTLRFYQNGVGLVFMHLITIEEALRRIERDKENTLAIVLPDMDQEWALIGVRRKVDALEERRRNLTEMIVPDPWPIFEN